MYIVERSWKVSNSLNCAEKCRKSVELSLTASFVGDYIVLRSKNKTAPLLLALFALLGLSACVEPPEIERAIHPLPEDAYVTDAPLGRYGGIFVLNETTQPTTFNPQVPNNVSTSVLLTRLLTPLLAFDPSSQTYEPALARSWEISEDNKSYTFYLRRGVLWSDGSPFTADDVIFTFDCILTEIEDPESGELRPKYPSRYYKQYLINGEKLRYTKVDDYTVRFDLPTVYGPFIYDIRQPILPKHKLHASFVDGSFTKQWSTQVAIESPEEIVGTGPFTIFSYKPGERLVLTPNPHYWKICTNWTLI